MFVVRTRFRKGRPVCRPDQAKGTVGLTAPLTIRDAGPDDAESIAAIHIASWQATYRGSMPDTYLDSLSIDQRLLMWNQILASASAPIRVWVAVIDNEIVGFCSVGPPPSQADDTGDPFELYTIYLRPGRERQGIGSTLMECAEREMVRMGVTMAELWVLEGNQRARRFYEASGWKSDGVEKLDQVFGQSVREVRYSKRLA